jgi:hypothetical protein
MDDLRSYFRDYEIEISNIPNEVVEIPSVPISYFIKDALTIKAWATDDMDELKKVNYNSLQLKRIEDMAYACEFINREWCEVCNTLNYSTAGWNSLSDKAINIINSLIHTLRFAFRNDPELITVIELISDRNTKTNIIKNLNDLYYTGKDNAIIVDDIIDNNLLNDAHNLSEQLMTELEKINGDFYSENTIRVMRDKTYYLLKNEVDELKHYGRYLFWHNPDRLSGYINT